MTRVQGPVPPAVAPLAAESRQGRAAGATVAGLFDAHARMVLGLCRVLLRDPHEAEDAAQQTFLSAYRGLLGGTTPTEPERWLAAIARNECRARIRKRMAAPVAVPVPEELPARDDPIATADERQELADVRTAVADLPARQRDAVVLRDFYGLSPHEVAIALSVSTPVVEALLARGRRRVRDAVRRIPSSAHGVIQVPIALRDALAREIPGFDATLVGIGIGGGGATAGVLAKLASAPLAAKIAAATSAVAVGAGATAKLADVGARDSGAATAAVSPTRAPSAQSSRSDVGTSKENRLGSAVREGGRLELKQQLQGGRPADRSGARSRERGRSRAGTSDPQTAPSAAASAESPSEAASASAAESASAAVEPTPATARPSDDGNRSGPSSPSGPSGEPDDSPVGGETTDGGARTSGGGSGSSGSGFSGSSTSGSSGSSTSGSSGPSTSDSSGPSTSGSSGSGSSGSSSSGLSIESSTSSGPGSPAGSGGSDSSGPSGSTGSGSSGPGSDSGSSGSGSGTSGSSGSGSATSGSGSGSGGSDD